NTSAPIQRDCGCSSLTAPTDRASVVAARRVVMLPTWAPSIPGKAATLSPTWTRTRTSERPTKRRCLPRASAATCLFGFTRSGLRRKASWSLEVCEIHLGLCACIVLALWQWIKDGMKNTFLLLLSVILGIVWPVHVGAAARPLRVAYMSTSATMASLWMAKETGAIAKEGIDVEVLSVNASLAIPAVIAAELDAIQISAAPVLTASLRGYDVVFVTGLLNTMIWNFYARPEVPNVEALKGKVVGTDRPATPVAYGTLVSLKKMGLSPKDVQL